jgi:2-methylcitrate dehydratase PrpD
MVLLFIMKRMVIVNLTNSIVDWALAADYKDLEPGQLTKLKWALADSFACMIGGSSTEVGNSILGFMDSAVTGDNVLICGTEQAANPRDAAFINAILANALDYDDTYEEKGKALCHPGATLVGSLLSLSSMKPCSGKDVLGALAVGYEVVARIGESVQPTPSRYEEVWGLNHFMVFGPAVIASRLLDFNRNTAKHAFGIAGVAANLPSAWKWNFDNRELPLSWQKDMVSWPAESGIRAALLANSGFRGCVDILDGEQGFWRMSASDQFDPSRILDELGEFTRIENLAFKPYPCCRWMHSIIEAFTKVYEGNELTEHKVSEVEVYTLSELANHFAVQHPKHMIDAEFSIPYVIAMVAQGIPPGLQWHTDENLHSERTRNFALKVKVVPADEFDDKYYQDNRIEARIIIKDNKGYRWIGECKQAQGGLERPLSEKVHREKVVGLIDPVLGDNRGDELLSAVFECDQTADFYRSMKPHLQR